MPELVPAAAPNAAGHTGDSDLRPRCLFSAGPALTTGPKTLIQAARPMVPCTRFRQRWTRSRVDAGPHVTGPASRPGCEQPFYRNVTAWHPATQPRNCALSRRARRVGWPLWQDWALIGGFGVRRAGHHHLGVVCSGGVGLSRAGSRNHVAPVVHRRDQHTTLHRAPLLSRPPDDLLNLAFPRSCRSAGPTQSGLGSRQEARATGRNALCAESVWRLRPSDLLLTELVRGRS